MRRRVRGGNGPKGPRRRRWQELREQRKRGIFLLPSLLTTGNLACGLLAIILTLDGRYDQAALAVFIAIVMDILDGKVARLTRTTTLFGVEFDSLADMVSFCVAPAVMLHAWVLSQLGRPAWVAAFLFVICGALRLARFNVHSAGADRRFFVGLPTPAAAGLVAAIILLWGEAELSRWELVAITSATYVVALLMVSTFRYWSFKEVDLAKRHPVSALLAVVLAVLIVATHPQIFVFSLFSIYVLSGPARRLVVRKTEGAPTAEANPNELR